jgi:predicted site-specific integrase-resolvase
MEKSAMWIPLMEYAVKKGVSLSTLRRYIKSDKIQYRVENGRYFLLDVEETPTHPSEQRITELAKSLRSAQEEIAELKTLIALYEEGHHSQLEA